MWVLAVFGLAVGLVFLVVIWWYLRKPHVKAFLGVAETAKAASAATFVALRRLFEKYPSSQERKLLKLRGRVDAGEGVEARLDALRKLRDHNYISEEEYERKRAELPPRSRVRWLLTDF